jgi:2-dehydro-3-deoxyphosphogluconate aldolase/(4S)-4-hydroxy-2-oxoglutarate aldolase
MANKADIVIQQIKAQKLMPLFYHQDMEVCISVIDSVYKSGIKQVEFTNRGESALNNFRELIQVKEERWPGLLLGIGTIKSKEEAQSFISAGADFIVCPGMNPEVGKLVHEAGLLWIPGCMTATEFMLAEQNSARLAKLFPGGLVGPSYLKGMREIFPKLMFMPTGGVEVTEENLSAWFKAGATVVGLGSKVISAEDFATKNYIGIENKLKIAVELIKKM